MKIRHDCLDSDPPNNLLRFLGSVFEAAMTQAYAVIYI